MLAYDNHLSLPMLTDCDSQIGFLGSQVTPLHDDDHGHSATLYKVPRVGI